MRIGILGALPAEINLMRRDFQFDDGATIEDNTVDVAGREFVFGRLYGQDAVVALSGIGKVAAATASTIMLTKFARDMLIFVGVAGAASPSAASRASGAEAPRVGDIVVANALLQYDFDATPIYPTKFHIPSAGDVLMFCDPELTMQCVEAAKSYIEDDMTLEIEPELLASFDITSPKVFEGLVMSGDRFIDDPAERAELSAAVSDVIVDAMPLAIEMEGAAMAQVAIEFGVPFAVVRVISDDAGENAAFDFARFVQGVSAYYSRGVVRRLLERM